MKYATKNKINCMCNVGAGFTPAPMEQTTRATTKVDPTILKYRAT